MNFDLNLDNYKKEELEEIFNLPANYNQSLINVNEQQLTKNILSDNSVDTSIKNKTIAFIAAAKRKLMNLTSTAATISETYKQIYNTNHQLEKSQVAESGSAFIIKPPSTPYAQSSPSEFYQGTINPLNKRILRKSLNIDTRFRENYYSTPSSNFHLDLPVRMTDVVSMQLTALEFPSTFYNVSRVFGNSHFSITIEDETITIVVPDGNYTPFGLCSYVNDYLTNYTTPVDNLFQHITFVTDVDNSGNGSGRMIAGIKSPHEPFEFALNFQKDKNGLDDRSTPLPLKLGWRMGYRSGLYQGNTSYVGEGIIDMVGPRYIYLVVDDFNNSVNDGFYAAFTSSVLNKNILARISLEGSVFSYLSQNNLSLITNARQYFGPVDLQKLQIQLLDEYGRVLDLNNMDYSFCLTLQSIYDL